jgi:hypothetical protein
MRGILFLRRVEGAFLSLFSMRKKRRTRTRVKGRCRKKKSFRGRCSIQKRPLLCCVASAVAGIGF